MMRSRDDALRLPRRRSSRQRHRSARWKLQCTLTCIITRCLGALLLLSAIVNLLYHSQLPDPSSPLTNLEETNQGWNATASADGGVRASRNASKQVIRKNRQGRIVSEQINKLRAEDLKGIGDDKVVGDQAEGRNLQDVRHGREELLDLLKAAGVAEIDTASIVKLPLWSQVTKLYGTGIAVYGLDTCQAFRSGIPTEDASIGPAGLFNTGTNPMAMYLSANCEMPNNKEKNRGMRWQVPWGKHMLADRKWNNTAKHDMKVNKKNVLPVVMIRDPFSWMQSMCKHPYAAKWWHGPDHCPNLVKDDGTSRAVTIEYPGAYKTWNSLIDVWSGWYHQYIRADYPRLIVRFEDLIFHPKELVQAVCQCAGATVRDDFQYVVGAGKWGAAHKGSSNMISAMAKYGNDRNRFNNLTEGDWRYTEEQLDRHLMDLFQYEIPTLLEVS